MESQQALAGIRVIEFAYGMAGPWIGRLMAYCGAEVIRVESRKRPDVTRHYVPPWAPELGIQTQLSPWLTDWNAGKRFIALDLTRPEAVELAKRLVTRCDVVVENYSTGVIDKLGLGYAALRQIKPDIIMFSTTGYGDTGPYRRYVTWGPNIEALSGLTTLSGFPERSGAVTQYAYPDAISPLHGLFAVMCALDHRQRTGIGQYINQSQYETMIGVLGDVMLEYLANGREPQRRGNASLQAAPHGCYRCQGDDRWCTISVGGEAEWERFCQVLQRPEWLTDARFATPGVRLAHSAELDRLIEAWTSVRNEYDIMVALQQAGIAAGVVQNVEDLMLRDRHLAERNFFEAVDHVKKGKVVTTGMALGLTGTSGRTHGTGAAIGQDNERVFREVLGMTPEEIQAWVAAGVIESAEDG